MMTGQSIVFAVLWFILGGALAAAGLPAIPDSERVVTRQEVKNYWIHHIRHAPVASRPLGLEPEKQRAWDARMAARQARIRAILAGNHDLDARHAQLQHNLEAWRLQENAEEVAKVEAELQRLREHLARMAALKAEKERSERATEAERRARHLEQENRSLRSRLASQPSC